MRQKNSLCLVLNSDYSPLGVISWKRAIIWSYRTEPDNSASIDIIDFYKNDYIKGTNNKKIPIPAVVKTLKYYKINYQSVNFSRKNLFIRDNYSCQYCGIKKDLKELTYDHVVPKSAWKHHNGSPTCWTNIVTACVTCNRKKRNRTPIEASMPLKNIPIAPHKSLKYLPIRNLLLRIRTDIPVEWSIYLPESYYNA